ncbi:MAG: DUF5676 family membrane protein [Betaproteobacteria bacterium]
MVTDNPSAVRHAGVPLPNRDARAISVLAFGLGLSLFLAISYVLCIVSYLIFPGIPINHAALSIFLPGFELLNWSSFCLGLIESLAYGWYVALIFGPLYNFFIVRWQ